MAPNSNKNPIQRVYSTFVSCFSSSYVKDTLPHSPVGSASLWKRTIVFHYHLKSTFSTASAGEAAAARLTVCLRCIVCVSMCVCVTRPTLSPTRAGPPGPIQVQIECRGMQQIYSLALRRLVALASFSSGRGSLGGSGKHLEGTMASEAAAPSRSFSDTCRRRDANHEHTHTHTITHVRALYQFTVRRFYGRSQMPGDAVPRQSRPGQKREYQEQPHTR